MGSVTRILFPSSSRLEADSMKELVQGARDASIELVKTRQPAVRQVGISEDWAEEAGRQGGVDPVEEFEEAKQMR